MTLDDIKLALKLKWRIQNDGDEDRENDGEDKTALSLNDTKTKCGRCGKKGHKAENCWAELSREQLQGKSKK